MSRLNYPPSSPYSASPQTSSYMGLLKYKYILPATDDVPFTVTTQYQYRPDKLSFDKYNNAAYWWIFTVRNRNIISDPIYDFIAGITIIIPSLITIQKALSS